MTKKLKAVVDTNVFVSAFLGSSVCRRVIAAVDNGVCTPVFTKDLLAELRQTLRDTRLFDLPESFIAAFLDNLKATSVVVVPPKAVTLCRDPKDNIVLEAALSVADCIVTGDKDLLVLKTFQGIPILTPREFLGTFLK